MPDINWGGDETTAPFSSRLDETAGNFILAEDNDGSTVLLEWDGSTWQYRGPVEMNGEDISGVGTLTATDATVSGTVDAGAVNTGSVDTKLLSSQTNQQPFITQPGGEVSVEQYVVSTTTTDILGTGDSAVLFVAGRRQGSNETFVDVLIAIQSGGGGPKVIGSDEFGTNPTRTYGNVGGTIPMSLSSGTYDVSVTSFVLVP